MKKITFILFALIAGTTFAQEPATADAKVFAEIVSPVTITAGSDLNFGTINGTATGGDVTVSFAGARTFTNGDMEVSSAATVSNASFNITAAEGYVYSISIPATVLTGVEGTEAMDLTFEHDRNNVTRRTGNGESQGLRVGGTLTVNNLQDAGSYTGTVEVTVAYE